MRTHRNSNTEVLEHHGSQQNIIAREKCTFSAFPIHKPVKEVKVNSGSSCNTRDPDGTCNQPTGKRFLKVLPSIGMAATLVL